MTSACRHHPTWGRTLTTVLERTFKELLSQNAIQHQFEDFILHHWDTVKNMTEEKFVQFTINDKSNCFPDFVQYDSWNLWVLLTILDYVKFSLYFQPQVQIVNEGFPFLQISKHMIKVIWKEIINQNFFNWYEWDRNGISLSKFNTEMEKSQRQETKRSIGTSIA